MQRAIKPQAPLTAGFCNAFLYGFAISLQKKIQSVVKEYSIVAKGGKNLKPENSTIRENIRALCAQHRMSVMKLEQAVGLGNGTISSWAVSSPSVANLGKVADYFGVSLTSLIEEKGAAANAER